MKCAELLIIHVSGLFDRFFLFKTNNLMSNTEKQPLIPHPLVTLDEEGYPTKEALEYIHNWTIQFKDGEMLLGHYYTDATKEAELIEYIQSIWYYNDAITVHENFTDIHTYGWSGNEAIIPYLEKTWYWQKYFWIERTGGHYYFNTAEDKHKVGDVAILKYMLGSRS
jgi:hypothetical protein